MSYSGIIRGMNKEQGGVIRRIGPEHESQGLPLMRILGKTVAEFGRLPKGRDVEDFPDNYAYLLSTTGETLVMLKQRRPIDYGRGILHKTLMDGFFAEVFDVDKHGRPQNWFSNPAALDELYQRIEITDEPDDLLNSSGLTPTRFDNTIRRRLGEKMSNRPKELTGGEKNQNGILGQFFANKQIEDAEKKKESVQDKSIRKEIIDKYFNANSTQGFNDEVGNSHFVITEDENSQLVRVSRELGVETHVVKMNEKWESASQNPISKLRDENGKPPLLISVDRTSFDTELKRPKLPYMPADKAIAQVGFYARDNSLFSFIEWQANTGDSGVGRIREGWYLLRGNDSETTRKLILKVGMDYLLTSKVRGLAKELG